MTAIVHTARVSYGGPDRLDITRKSAGEFGIAFAPSWSILQPLLEARKRWSERVVNPLVRAGEEKMLWDAYVDAYTREMRASYVKHREKWHLLLNREVVTLVCYCADAKRCHRRLLAEILTVLGATNAGERT